MRISWISFARIAEGATGPTSSSASARYRIILPARELRARGHEVTVRSLNTTTSSARPEDLGRTDALVIGKLLGDGRGNYGAAREVALGLALNAARDGTRIIADLTDDHFDQPAFLDFYRRLARLGAEFVASSDVLARIAADKLSCDATVIGDPYEGPHGSPGFPEMGKQNGRWKPRVSDAATASARALRLLWFGHPANVPEIASEAPRLARFARSRRVELRVLTVPSDSLEAWCSIANRFAEGEMSISVESWSQEGLWSALESCDAVVLPTESLPFTKVARSANRLVETLRAGRFAIAHPVTSYLEFRDFAWIGEDLCEGIGWALAHPESAKQRILRGQAYVEAQYSPAAIGESWEALVESAKPPVPPSSDAGAAGIPA